MKTNAFCMVNTEFMEKSIFKDGLGKNHKYLCSIKENETKKWTLIFILQFLTKFA